MLEIMPESHANLLGVKSHRQVHQPGNVTPANHALIF